MPQINKIYVNKNYNSEGEISEQVESIQYGIQTEPKYIKLYLADILYLTDLPKKHEKVLIALLKRASYADNEQGMYVDLSSYTKSVIAKEIGYEKISSINNSLYELSKGKLLIKLGRSCYQFNPYFFGVGKWKDISKLRLTIDYDEIKGRTFKSVCEYNTQKNDK